MPYTNDSALVVPARGAFRSRLFAAVMSLTVIMLAISPTLGSVSTDQADYAPGSVVTISGDNSNFDVDAGYLPDESVHVDVYGPNGYYATCEAVAGADGSWSCQVTLWDSPLAVGDYSYTATGLTSGTTENGTFTDATNVATTTTLILGASGIALGSSVNLSGALANNNSADPALPPNQTIIVDRYGTPGCGGSPTLIVSDSTGNAFNYDYTPGAVGTFYIRAAYAGANNGLSGNDRVNWQQSSSGCLALTVDVAPFVSSTTPVDNAVGVAASANVLVQFSEDVSVSGAWFSISCASSGSHAAVVTGGPQNFTLNPNVNFTAGEVCTVTIDDASVADTDTLDPPDNMAADYVFDFTIFNPNTPPSVVVTGVSHGSSYAKGSVPAAGCSVTDTEDGPSTFPAVLSAITGPDAAFGIGSQTATCDYTDTGGLSAPTATATYTITDGTAPTISYVVTPAAPDGSNGWYVSNVSLIWTVTEGDSPSTLVKTGCVDQSLTADQPATTYSCSATSAGGSAGPVSVTIKRDATAPTITDNGPTPGSPDGLNNWYVNPLTNNFSAADGGSGLDVACDLAFPKDVSSGAAEGPAVTVPSGSCSDLAGNTAASIDSAAFKIDLTDPVITASVLPVRPGSGWWNIASGAPTVTYTCSDSGSGIASCSGPFTFGEGENLGNTGFAADNAGNSNSAGVTNIDVDLTAPTATVAFPVNGGVYIESSWNAGCLVPGACGTAGDLLSGLDFSEASMFSVSLNKYWGGLSFNSTAEVFFPAGDTPWSLAFAYANFPASGGFVVHVRDWDNAGNSGGATSAFTLNRYTIDYQSPLDDTISTVIRNTGKYGRVIPVKVVLYKDGVAQSSANFGSGDAFTIKVQLMPSCSSGFADGIEMYADAGASNGNTNLFRWADGQLIYNLDTKAPPNVTMEIGQCYRIDIYLNNAKLSYNRYAVFQPVK